MRIIETTQVEDCKEFIETVNEWFARHVAGEKQDNSAETMWNQAQARLARLDDPRQWVRPAPPVSASKPEGA